MAYSSQDLLRIHLFDGLKGDECLKLYEVATQHRLGQNVTVITEGEIGDGFFVIIKGAVRVTKKIDGMERLLAHLGNMDIFGEMSMLEGYPRCATVTTTEPTDLLEFKMKDMEMVFEKYPNIAKHVFWNLSRRLSSKLRNFGENIREITVDWV